MNGKRHKYKKKNNPNKPGGNSAVSRVTSTAKTPHAAQQRATDTLQKGPKARTGIQLIEQKRAAFALKKVQEAIADSGCKDSEFRAYARSLPAMIQTNGLGQAAAFYRSKGEKTRAYLVIYTLLGEWLTSEKLPFAGYSDLLDGITDSDMHRYRRAQAEAQALLSWVKKFAEALCVEDKDKEEADS